MSKYDFSRFGMTENPFHAIKAEDIVDMSKVHVNLAVDDHLAKIKENVFSKTQSSVVVLTGPEGVGKTHRLIVSAYEAAVNELFYAYHNVADVQTLCCDDLATSILSAKKISVFNTPKWHSNLSKLAKKMRKNSGDPSSFGLAIAEALNANAPSFLLINDLHRLTGIKDADLFCQCLGQIVTHLSSGVLVMITATDDFYEGFYRMQPKFAQSITCHLSIPHLNKDDAKQILSKRLSTGRLVNDIDPLYPFDMIALEQLLESSRGLPTDLIKFAEISIDYALDQDALAIDGQLVTDAIGFIKKPTLEDSFTSDSSQLPSITPQPELSKQSISHQDELLKIAEEPDSQPSIVKIPPQALEIECDDDEELLEDDDFYHDSPIVQIDKNLSPKPQANAQYSNLPLPVGYSYESEKKKDQFIDDDLKSDEYDEYLSTGIIEVSTEKKKKEIISSSEDKNDPLDGSCQENNSENDSLDDSTNLANEKSIVKEEKNVPTPQKKNSSKTKKNSSPTKNKAGKKSVKTTSSNEKTAPPNTVLKKEGEKISQDKKIEKQKTQHVRHVKVKCPECEEIFPITLDEHTNTLVCPHCGFEGEI